MSYKIVDLADGRSPFPAAAHKSCPRCHALWEVSGFAWQYECKCRRWSIDVTGRESWQPIPGAMPYCCGREMERAIAARQYECACGRTVPDEIAFTVDPDAGTGGAWVAPWPPAAAGSMHILSAPMPAPNHPTEAQIATRERPVRVPDFEVWKAMRERDRGMADFTPESRDGMTLHGIVFDAFTPREATISGDYCRNARARIDAWLVDQMERLMRDCEIAGMPLDKRESFIFSAGTNGTTGPEHGHWFTFDDYREARSRILAAKVAASDAARAESARRVVLGPIDDESEA